MDSDSTRFLNVIIDENSEKSTHPKTRKRKRCLNSSIAEPSNNDLNTPVKCPKLRIIEKKLVKRECVKTSNSADESSDSEPKLTRAKAQALNKKVLNVPPLNAHKPTPEVEVLIREELKSDDEDEEYQPGEDDIHSDDDHNTTISDIDSLPRTPYTPRLQPYDEGTPKSMHNSLFKIPRIRTDSLCSSPADGNNIIAQRTRSKFCLETIDIEEIESRFYPPDIPHDMLNHELDVDNNWLEFLNVLTKPLNTTVEDDDEADPEYVAADKIPVDKEELRDVNISKKELTDLIDELLQSLDDEVDFNDLDMELPSSSAKVKTTSRSKKQPSRSDYNNKMDSLSIEPIGQEGTSGLNNTLISNNVEQQNVLSPYQQMSIPFQQVSTSYQQTSTPFQRISSPFQQLPSPYQQMSTHFQQMPSGLSFQTQTSKISGSFVANNLASSGILNQNGADTSALNVSAMIASTSNASFLNVPPLNTSSSNASLNTSTALAQYQVPIPINTLNPYQGSYFQNGIIQLPMYQQIVVLVPTIDILKHQNQQQPQQQIDNISGLTLDDTIANNAQNNTQNPPEKSEKPDNANESQKSTEFSTEADTTSTSKDTTIGHVTRYQLKLFKHLKSDPPPKNIFTGKETGFTDQQKNIMDQQIRMHIQLSTQIFLQTYQHPIYLLYANRFKHFLTQLDEVHSTNSVCQINNLKTSLDFISNWEREFDEKLEENSEYYLFLKNESEHFIKYKGGVYIMKFHKRFMDKIVSSSVFMYPELLPKIPIRPMNNERKSGFAPIEDYLLAQGLQNFYNKRNKLASMMEERQKVQKVTLGDVCRDIARHFFYYDLKAKALYPHILGRRAQKDLLTPIQYYFRHNRAPKVQHDLKSIDFNNIACPKNQPLGQLPYIWAKYVENIKAVEHDKKLNPEFYARAKTNAPTQTVAPTIRNTVCRNLSAELDNESQKQPDTFGQIKITVKYAGSEPIDIEPITLNVPINNDCLPTGNSILIENRPIKSSLSCNENNHFETKSICSLDDFELSINDRISGEKCLCNCKCNSTKKNNEEGQRSNLLNLYFEKEYSNSSDLDNQPSLTKKSNSKKNKKPKFLQKLYLILKTFNSYKTDGIKLFGDKNQHLINVYNCLKIFEVYSELMLHCEMSSTSSMKRAKQPSSSSPSPSTSTSPPDDGTIKKLKTNPEETGGGGGAATASTSSSSSSSVVAGPDNTSPAVVEKDSPLGGNKRGQKLKVVDNSRLLVLPESKEDSNEKDFIFAQNFMDKVEETFCQENREEKFLEFEKVLRNFNPVEETVAILFQKLEKIFLPDHPELAELFLAFLLPGQAAQVGKFIEHFMQTNMSNFLTKLNVFFNKQPAQIRKIITCLKELSNEEDLKMDKIKSRVLPLLKGNTLLIEWFLQCFPNEQYPECLTNEYETLSLRKAIETADDTEVYEYIPQTEILPDPIDNPCHLKYMNGRVYYGNRFLVPGKLAFMPGSINVESTAADMQEQKLVAQDQGNGEQSSENINSYHCMHSIKQYGDARIRESQKSHTETDTNNQSVDDGNSVEPDQRRVESSKTDEKTSGGEENNLFSCDNLTLKAHAIRLNPSAHVSEHLNSEDAANILKNENNLIGAHSLDKDSQTKSPKKLVNRGVSTVTGKAQQRKSPKSPSNIPTKKVINRSMASGKKAIQMAKKLKRIVDKDDQSDKKELQQQQQKRKIKLKKDAQEKKQNAVKPNQMVKNEIVELRIAEKNEHTDEIKVETQNESKGTKTLEANVLESNVDDIKIPESSSKDTKDNSNVVDSEFTAMVDWSREEDKLVLEHIKLSFSSEMDLVKELQNKLPKRSKQDIYDRFKFLMHVIETLRK